MREPKQKVTVKNAQTKSPQFLGLKMKLGTVFIQLLLQHYLDRNTVPSPKDRNKNNAKNIDFDNTEEGKGTIYFFLKAWNRFRNGG